MTINLLDLPPHALKAFILVSGKGAAVMGFYSEPFFWAYYFTIVFSAFFISYSLSWMLTYIFSKLLVVMDKPNERSNHKKPVPRGGGLALMTSVIIFLTVVQVKGFLILGLLLLTIVSFLDDLKSLNPLSRLLAQATAVGIALYSLPAGAFDGLLPPIADKTLTAIIWLWFVNLYNFMDGIDGLAGSQTCALSYGILVIALTLGTLHSDLLLISCIVLAAAVGFTLWNWHPAKIFLGDAGSIPLGFILGYLLIELAQKGYWAAALILPSYYLLDASFTLLSRLFRGKKIWQAHSEHAYQKAARGGMRHDDIARLIAATSLVNMVLAVASVIRFTNDGYLLAGAYGVSAAVFAYLSRTRAPVRAEEEEAVTEAMVLEETAPDHPSSEHTEALPAGSHRA
jgi:UDP-N-acetylmuramyl pentapeptide phosphotransferase/UDP-N-acetylglucosamine-1-phosphate transferase